MRIRRMWTEGRAPCQEKQDLAHVPWDGPHEPCFALDGEEVVVHQDRGGDDCAEAG
jgi:hypothetical protein